MIIFLNFRFVKIKPSEFNELLPGRLDGVGAFETMRLYHGVVFAFEEHMERLARGLKYFGLRLPVSRQEIQKVIKQLSRKTNLRNARVRVIIWRESEKNISISLQKLSLPAKTKYQNGYKVLTSKFQRNRKAHTHLKSIDYAMLKKAHTHAFENGYDEAVFFNSNGYLVEGTRTNIFFVKAGKLFTPRIECGCLNGITRKKVIACARTLGIAVKAVKARRAALTSADEAFLTGSTLEIMPVKSVDGKAIGRRRPGPVTRALQKAYSSTVHQALFKKE